MKIYALMLTLLSFAALGAEDLWFEGRGAINQDNLLEFTGNQSTTKQEIYIRAYKYQSNANIILLTYECRNDNTYKVEVVVGGNLYVLHAIDKGKVKDKFVTIPWNPDWKGDPEIILGKVTKWSE